MTNNRQKDYLDNIVGIRRFETFSRNEMNTVCMDLTHAVYPHDQIFGKYCTLQEYVDCPPADIFNYLSKPETLQEWTYSMRDMQKTEDPDIYSFVENVADDTLCYCKTFTNEEAMTVDFHCAWDQYEDLWMIYLMRIVPAQRVFNKPGSVIFWSNCHHPYYDQNPYPEKAPKNRELWVGDVWDLFYAGHWIEMQNLKKILEYRHQQHIKT